MSDRKKKILFLIQLPPPIHGVSVINKLVYKIWPDKKFDKHLLEIKFSNNIKELRAFHLRKIVKSFKLFYTLIKNLKKIKPHYVYFSLIPVGYGFIRDFIISIIIKLYRVKIIYHIHNKGIKKNSNNFINRFLYKTVFKNSIIIHVSQNLLKEEFSKLKLKNSKKFYLYNTTEEFDLTKIHKHDNKILSLLFLSNIFKEKGIILALDVAEKLKQLGIKFKLEIAGEFWNMKIKKQVLKYISDKDISDVVNINGFVYGENKWKLYKNSDIFLFPSYFKMECMPIVIVEAMKTGVPIISSDIGSINEIIEHGKNGFILDELNVEDIIKYINKLMDRNISKGFSENQVTQFNKKLCQAVFSKNLEDIANSV